VTERVVDRTPDERLGLGGAFRSPLVAFCIWIAVGLLLYQLHWSVLYRELRWDTVLLLGAGFAVFLFWACTSAAGQRGGSRPTHLQPIVLITVYFFAAFADNGGVPFVQVLRGQPYDVYGFGIPGLHVLMLAFSGYYGVRLFREFLANPSPRAFVAYLWVFLLLGSVANRSALSFLLFATLILYLRNRKLPPWRIAMLIGVTTVFLLVFGQFGNARLSNQIRDATGRSGASDAVVSISGASPEFRETGLSPAWLWSYIYMSSPIANLNQAFAYEDDGFCGLNCDASGLVVHEMIPDVAGARLGRAFGLAEFDKSVFLIAPDITASTTFGSAVGYAGQLGAYAMLAFLAMLSLLTLRRFDGTDVREEAIALLATLLFFSFFENMVAYSPLSLQLVWVWLAARYRSRLL